MADVVGLLYEDELRKATAEIERLTAENERLRAALTEVVFMSGMPIDIPPEDMLANAGATAMTALDPQKYGVDQRSTPQKEKLPHFREMRGILKEEGK